MVTHSCQFIDLLVDISHAAGGELGVLFLRSGGGVGGHHKAGFTSVVKSVMNSAEIVPDLKQEVREQLATVYTTVNSITSCAKVICAVGV